MISVLLQSCQSEFIPLDPRACDFIEFKNGSYWLYNVYSLDSVLLRKDSIYISGRNITIETIDGIEVEQLRLSIGINDDNIGGSYDSYSNYYNTQKWDLPLYKLNKNDGMVISKDSIIIEGKTYYDIIAFDLKNPEFKYIVYFARNYGVVYYYSDLEEEYWVLFESYIRQY